MCNISIDDVGRNRERIIVKLAFHPIANIFPLMTDEEIDSLAEDIKKNGIHNPIWMFQEKVLDGRNRAKACEKIKQDPPIKQFAGTAKDAISFVWSENVERRHLNSSQKAIAAKKREILDKEYAKEVVEKVKQEAKERQKAAGTEGSKGGRGKKKTLVETIPQGFSEHDRKTATVLAKASGTNRKYLELAEKIIKEAPSLVPKIESGEITIPKAIKEIKREKVTEQLNTLSIAGAAKTDGLYDVIVLDPPWPMQKIERDCRPNQVEFDYPTLTEEQLAELEIPCADNCHVWIWTTHRFLPMSLRLLNAWNLKYVCTFVWHKPGGFQPVGLPQYNCEFVIYARRGSPIFLDTKDFSVCFNAPRGKHSEKPEEFYDTLRRVTGGRRLDMFNRRTINGFDGWGNEAK